ncbi:hypothetical protein D9615_000132 [Tricholomella constricta]|uniref:Uncharacterized protein n=1 Tax=Tricholomella constricta TaxID=117010 RepID=A0A8H5HSC5_9AGAR|nr:hypothetical protein D9615_000132 [Tricholomella constricta]
MYRSASPYRATSPYQQPAPDAHRSDYHPRPYSPAPGRVPPTEPGSITYTTSTGHDGRPLYHPFRHVPNLFLAVAASYPTPAGIVDGIQWVPGEATHTVPYGAQPATVEFAASWNRGQLGRDDEKALNDWGRDDEKRRMKDAEKEARRLREQGLAQGRIDHDAELRKARERDAQARERRKSFNAGAVGSPPAAAGAYTFPSSGSTAGYPGSGYPPSPYSGYGEKPAGAVSFPGYATSGGSNYSRERKYSTGAGSYSDLDRQLGDLDLRDRDREYAAERERKISGVGRSRKYSTSEAGGERPRAVSGNLGRPDGYGTAASGPYGAAAASGAYSSGGRPYSAAGYQPSASPNARTSPNLPAASGPYNSSSRPYSAAGYQPSTSPNMRTSPNVRSAEAPYVPPGGGYPPSNYTATSPPRESISRSTTPFGGPSPNVYPRGHVMEGQPVSQRDRSRAPSPMPGGAPPAGPYSSSAITFPQPGTSPNMSGPVPFPGEHGAPQQLAAPEGFSRPVNGSHPFTPFDIIKVQDMEKFWSEIPRMPAVLVTHDVFDEDWVRLMQDVALAWAGKLPVPEFARGGQPPKRSSLIADLVDLWNNSFFLIRGAELVLYKGRERRSGRHIGVVDKDLPYLEEPDDCPSSDDEEEEHNDSDDSDLDYGQGRYNAYGNSQQQLAEVFEAGRRRKEAKMAAKADQRRRRHERNRRRREKYRDRKYSLYLTYVPTSVVGGGGHMGPGVPAGYPTKSVGGGGYGMGGRY